MSKTKRAKLAGLVCFAIAVIALLFSGNHQMHGVHASASGPIAGVTGCPDENDCTLCHTIPSGQRGEFFITAPNTYTPGQTYEITVTHINNDEVTPRLKWGFELTSLTFPDLLATGDLQSLPMSTLTQVVNGGPGGSRQYIEHTYEGGFEGQLGGAMWTFNWTAPPTDVGEIRLYASGNQANGDFDNTGDQIYRAHVSIVPDACIYLLSSPAGFFPVTGGSGSVGVSVAASCNWNVVDNVSWITLTSNPNGIGSDTVTFNVDPNSTHSARSATLTIAGKLYTIVQDAGLGDNCRIYLSSSSYSSPAAGSNGAFNIYAEGRCGWQAVSPVEWITITSGNVGIGNGQVSFHVAPNPAPVPRTALINVGGTFFKVKQKQG